MNPHAVDVQEKVVERGLRLFALRFGRFPQPEAGILHGMGKLVQVCRNSRVAVSATVCLLHAVARALRNFVVRIHDQVAVGCAADFQPGERPWSWSTNHAAFAVET